MSAEEHVGTTVKVTTPYVVNMQASINEFASHVEECNNDFKENIHRKVQTIKLKSTSELYKKVEELKTQEAGELSQLNKHFSELDVKCKKIERKVSFWFPI